MLFLTCLYSQLIPPKTNPLCAISGNRRKGVLAKGKRQKANRNRLHLRTLQFFKENMASSIVQDDKVKAAKSIFK